jgi:hypothetical protein
MAGIGVHPLYAFVGAPVSIGFHGGARTAYQHVTCVHFYTMVKPGQIKALFLKKLFG